MIARQVDVTNHGRIAELGQRVLDGGQLDREDAQWLFNLESSADIYDLLSWANRVREFFKGNKIHLCSIVNAKAGACSENCSFCAQSSFLSNWLALNTASWIPNRSRKPLMRQTKMA